jgi:hypothetical protein
LQLGERGRVGRGCGLDLGQRRRHRLRLGDALDARFGAQRPQIHVGFLAARARLLIDGAEITSLRIEGRSRLAVQAADVALELGRELAVLLRVGQWNRGGSGGGGAGCGLLRLHALLHERVGDFVAAGQRDDAAQKSEHQDCA